MIVEERGCRATNGLSSRHALTRAEVLVFGLTLGLLGLVLLPALASGQLSRRATCLQNLRAIGAATQAYAEDDATELLLPIHQMMVNNTQLFAPAFANTMWSWRTANFFAWGGATATEEFLVLENFGPIIGRGWTRCWGAQTRPLTRFLYPEITEDPDNDEYVTDLPLFHCPQDAGYVESHEPYGDADCPQANVGRPCYTTLGSSYRANLAGSFAAQPNSNYTGAFSYGPWGHKRADIANPSRVILGADALYGEMVDALGYTGWHGGQDSDNVLYCDGAARLTQFIEGQPIPAAPRLPLGPGYDDLWTRGDTYQLDVYPTPGARIWGYSVGGGRASNSGVAHVRL